jgi:hypothetical protein
MPVRPASARVLETNPIGNRLRLRSSQTWPEL